MPDIHKTAIVSEYAKLEEGVIVGPYSIIEGDVKRDR
jgi:acyl-[acyl carrier protein]--UDP-N-acetylglucosamine O-acyltransferase